MGYLNLFNASNVKIVITLSVNVLFSVLGFILTLRIIPRFKDIFIKANLKGVDMSKKEKKEIAEAAGVIAGCVFLIILFLFIPVPFIQYWTLNGGTFPHHEFVELVAALLSICCMLFLGFADDVLDLRWRHKLLLPTMASLPLLMVYYVTYNGTTVLIPIPFRQLVGKDIYLGDCSKAHLFSLYFMIPFLSVTMGLLYYNWYPSSVFVGDTYCYFAGMTFAVVGILGHFSKTMILFFIPQVINFLFSIPQLFHFVPCPRHRLPKYNSASDLLEPSIVAFKPTELHPLGRFCVHLARLLGLINYSEYVKEEETVAESTNFTLINFFLKIFGPTHERTLTVYLLSLQVFCSCFAFFCRYGLARIFYDV